MQKAKTTFVLLVILIAVFLFISYTYWNSLLKPVGNSGDQVEFVVEKGEGVSSIAERLQKEGLIKNSLAFQILVRVSGIGSSIQAGRFYVSSNMGAKELAATLTHGVLERKITVIEGWRVEEIADYLEKETNGKIKGSEFLKYAKEGYMFPDTYRISEDASAEDISKIMTDNFNRKVDETVTKNLPKNGLNLKDVVILASIVEREVRFSEDRPIVAGILLRRLADGQALETDATVQYALGYQKGKNGGIWWKKELTVDDLAINSPYNTRKVAGLPPGPICNPGLDSIKAAINPTDTKFWFYLSDKDGKMHYAVTLEEHNDNVRKYIELQ